MKKLIAAATLSLAALAYGQDVSCPKAGCSSSGSGSVAVGDITGLGSGVAAWLATATSANLATAVSDETGTGALMFNINPVLENGTTAAGAIFFREDQDNGTNTVKLIGPASTADQILTLPSATDTLVGKATTDTLTNKTLTGPLIDNGATSAGYTRFLEDSDNGPNYIQVNGQDNLANNRTIALPDYNGTVRLYEPAPSYYVFEDDCDVIGTNSGLDSGCRFLDGQIVSTGAAIANGAQDANHPGVRKCNGGTAATSGCWLSAATTANGSTVTPAAGYRITWNIKADSNVSVAGSDNYSYYWGTSNVGTGQTNPNTGSGFYLSYNDATNSGNFVMNVCNAASCSTANSSTAPSTGAWRWYQIWVESTSSVHFYDCGATWPATGNAGCTEMTNSPVTASLPANFPTATGVGPAFGIVRAATSANQRAFELDYVHILATGYAR